MLLMSTVGGLQSELTKMSGNVSCSYLDKKGGTTSDVQRYWRVAHSIWSPVCCVVQPVGVDNTGRRKFDKEEYLERARQREQREKVICIMHSLRFLIFHQHSRKLWPYFSFPPCIANFSLCLCLADPGGSPERQRYAAQLQLNRICICTHLCSIKLNSLHVCIQNGALLCKDNLWSTETMKLISSLVLARLRFVFCYHWASCKTV